MAPRYLVEVGLGKHLVLHTVLLSFLALRAPRNEATTVLEKTVTTTVEMKFGTHVVYLYSPRRQMHLVDYVIEQRVSLTQSTGIRTCTTARTRS